MNALLYFFAKRTKNQFLQFIRSPGKVIYGAIMVFAVVMAFTSGTLPSYTYHRDINELYVILWALYTFMFITVSKNGFSNGSALFSMADVNLLFTSPIKNTKILIHAMIQQLGRSLFVGVVLLLQFNTVHNYYGVGYGMFLLMVVFYGLTVFFSHMMSVMIYTLCSGNEKRATSVKAVYYSVIVAFVVCGMVGSFDSGSFTAEKAVECLSGGAFKFFPVSGFLVMILEGLGKSNSLRVIMGIALLILFTVIFFVAVSVRKFDFYEDVITSAEINRNVGSVDSEARDTVTPKKVKVGKTGINKGFSATAIYEKNKIENRRGQVLYIDTITVVYAVITGICALTLDSLLAIFVLMIYLLMFSVSAGRWAKELKYHYIYLIPEKSSKKLFNMLKEQLPAYFIQSVFVVLPLHFILRMRVIDSLSVIFARFGFCLLFTGVTLILKRMFSTTEKGAFYGFIYMIFCLIASMPAVIAATVASTMLVFNFEVAFFLMFVVNTAVSFILVIINRNILDKGM